MLRIHSAFNPVSRTNSSHNLFPNTSSFIALSAFSMRLSSLNKAPLIALRSRYESIRSAIGSPATAGGFARSIVISRQKRPMNPDGHLLSNSGSDLSMMNVGLNATEEIFPAYRRDNSAAVTKLHVLVLLYAVPVL